jgi:hypothetical protein
VRTTAIRDEHGGEHSSCYDSYCLPIFSSMVDVADFASMAP